MHLIRTTTAHSRAATTRSRSACPQPPAGILSPAELRRIIAEMLG